MKNTIENLRKTKIILVISLILFTSLNYSQKIIEKKGNGTFIPDVNNSFKLLQNKTSPKNFEKLLPTFRVKDSLTECSSYNEKTNEVVQNKCLKSQYSFMYKDEVLVNVEVTSQNDEINRFEYFFDVKQNATKFKNQIIKNGFIYDSRLTKVYIKLGFKFCLAYTKKPGYTFVYYNENKFTISK